MVKKAVFFAVAALITVTVLGGCSTGGLFMKGRYAKQELLKFRYSGGGNMSGNAFSTELEKIDGEHALLTISNREQHDQEPVVEEYTVDLRALYEIREIFLEEGMYRWQDKKFSRLQVLDGETYRYSFVFTDDEIDFHSQLFPEKYGEKLAKIDRVIEKYKAGN